MSRLAALLFLLVFSASQAPACVGKDLAIGVLGSPQELVYAELIAQMLTERTGTSVKVVAFKDAKALYDAVRKADVGVIIENTERGMKEVSLPPEPNGKSAYEALKREYRKTLNLVFLEPVFVEGGNRFYAPVVLAETLSHLPALPKLINKLTGALTEESYTKLAKAVQADEKPKKLAREFLKAKKLI